MSSVVASFQTPCLSSSKPYTLPGLEVWPPSSDFPFPQCYGLQALRELETSSKD